MNKSEQIDKIAEAFSLARAEFKPLEKRKLNPYHKNKYIALVDIFNSTIEALSKHGIAFFQFPITNHENCIVIITTMLIHKSGQWLLSELTLKPASSTPQAVGSAITYGRRYSALTILGIDGNDISDDDGNAASIVVENKFDKNDPNFL